MRIFTKREVELSIREVVAMVDDGAVFIYPTDTIYGLGCNAMDEAAVAKIRYLKNRQDIAMSIIAPSKEWIKNNCEITKEAAEWLDKLPGPYTLILNLKDKKAIANNVCPKDDTVGVRIPDHWISRFVEVLDIPIITTSANVTGKGFMTSTEDLDKDIKKGLQFVVYEGEKKGRPSQIVNLTGKQPTIKKR